jgi:hypothetical protein
MDGHRSAATEGVDGRSAGRYGRNDPPRSHELGSCSIEDSIAFLERILDELARV